MQELGLVPGSRRNTPISPLGPIAPFFPTILVCAYLRGFHALHGSSLPLRATAPSGISRSQDGGSLATFRYGSGKCVRWRWICWVTSGACRL